MKRGKRWIEGLGDYMKDQNKFKANKEEDIEAVYRFLTAYRKIIVRRKWLSKLKDSIEEQRKDLLKQLKRLSKEETQYYNIAKKLPFKDAITTFYVRKDKGKYYRIEIDWFKYSKSISLGKDLSAVEKIIKAFEPTFNKVINESNFKKVILSHLKKPIDDFLFAEKIERFQSKQKIVWDESKNCFKYQKLKSDEDFDHKNPKNILTKDIKGKKSERIVLDKAFYKKRRAAKK